LKHLKSFSDKKKTCRPKNALGQENEKFEQRAQNFEPLIHHVVEEEVATQGIILSRGVEPVLVIKQETIVLPRAKPIIVEGVFMAIRMRYIKI
jgi:hypothetical protein